MTLLPGPEREPPTQATRALNPRPGTGGWLDKGF